MTGTGYTGLFEHVRTQDPEDYKDAQEGAILVISSIEVSAPQTFQCTVHNLNTIDTCQNMEFLPHVRYRKLDFKTLMMYIAPRENQVESSVSEMLSFELATMFDQWANANMRFLTVYATYPAKTETEYAPVCLKF